MCTANSGVCTAISDVCTAKILIVVCVQLEPMCVHVVYITDLNNIHHLYTHTVLQLLVQDEYVLMGEIPSGICG